jgi:hypothetical protein
MEYNSANDIGSTAEDIVSNFVETIVLVFEAGVGVNI